MGPVQPMWRMPSIVESWSQGSEQPLLSILNRQWGFPDIERTEKNPDYLSNVHCTYTYKDDTLSLIIYVL